MYSFYPKNESAKLKPFEKYEYPKSSFDILIDSLELQGEKLIPYLTNEQYKTILILNRFEKCQMCNQVNDLYDFEDNLLNEFYDFFVGYTEEELKNSMFNLIIRLM